MGDELRIVKPFIDYSKVRVDKVASQDDPTPSRNDKPVVQIATNGDPGTDIVLSVPANENGQLDGEFRTQALIPSETGGNVSVHPGDFTSPKPGENGMGIPTPDLIHTDSMMPSETGGNVSVPGDFTAPQPGENGGGIPPLDLKPPVTPFTQAFIPSEGGGDISVPGDFTTGPSEGGLKPTGGKEIPQNTTFVPLDNPNNTRSVDEDGHNIIGGVVSLPSQEGGFTLGREVGVTTPKPLDFKPTPIFPGDIDAGIPTTKSLAGDEGGTGVGPQPFEGYATTDALGEEGGIEVRPKPFAITPEDVATFQSTLQKRSSAEILAEARHAQGLDLLPEPAILKPKPFDIEAKPRPADPTPTSNPADSEVRTQAVEGEGGIEVRPNPADPTTTPNPADSEATTHALGEEGGVEVRPNPADPTTTPNPADSEVRTQAVEGEGGIEVRPNPADPTTTPNPADSEATTHALGEEGGVEVRPNPADPTTTPNPADSEATTHALGEEGGVEVRPNPADPTTTPNPADSEVRTQAVEGEGGTPPTVIVKDPPN
jgi:hypothetical protein